MFVAMLVGVPVVLLLTQLHVNVPGKAAEDSPSPWDLEPKWQTQRKLLA